MRFAVFACFLIFTSSLVHNCEAETTRYEAQHNQQRIAAERVNAFWSSLVQENRTQAEQNGPYDPRQDYLYRAYLAFTIVGVIGAVIGIRVIYLQTKATQDAAKAARDNALAVINAERAWIMVDVGWDPTSGKIIYGSGSSGNTINVNTLLTCRNDGRSVAWITEKWATMKAFNRIPKHPEFNDEERLFQRAVQPIAANKADSGHRLWLSVLGSHEQRASVTIVVYGYVKYRTIFDRQGETRFGYILTTGDALDRLSAEFPEYNRNT